MTTKKKKFSAAKPKPSPLTQTPSTTSNRYDELDTDDAQPSYSSVVAANRVSESLPTKPDSNNTSLPEPSLRALMNAIQNITFRMDDRDENIGEQFKAIDERFIDMKQPTSSGSPPETQESGPVTKRHNTETPSPDNDNSHERPDHEYDVDAQSTSQVHPVPATRRGDYRSQFRPPSSAESTNNFLNQNEFYVAISGNKIKYVDMEKYIFQKVLSNDSAEALKKIYSAIGRMIAFGFSTQVNILPSFQDLDRDTSFEKLFLCGLFSDNLDKAKSVFDQIGEIILDFLQNDKCISETKAPEAFTIIEANESLSGWELLETLLKQRLTICGADLDTDLDELRVNLVLRPNEPIRKFYIRTQKLYNEYKYNATDYSFIPAVKIMRKFLQQLTRCESYRPTLSKYIDDLSEHVREFGSDNNLSPLTFSLKDVYDRLVQAKVPSVPPKLEPNPTNSNTGDSETIQKLKQQNDAYSSLIASLEQTDTTQFDTPYDDLGVGYNDPTMCAKMAMRNKCTACLLGFHNENDCFLRGDKFIPPGLKRRLKIYNQVHGDAPPPNHKIREWDPPLLPPIHKNQPGTFQSDSSSGHKFSANQRARPFNNTKTKSGINEIKSMETQDDTQMYDESHHILPATDPSISALVTEQVSFENQFENSQEETSSMYLCSFSNKPDIESDHVLLCNSFEEDFNPILDHENNQVLICSVNQNHSEQPPIRDPGHSLHKIISSQSNLQNRIQISPINDPFQHHPISNIYTNVFDCTPLHLRQSIDRIHIKCNHEPNKRFFQHHSKQINKLDKSKFQDYCHLTFHIDGGANCGSIKDKSLYYFFHESKGKIQTVAGTLVQSQGWGAVLLRFGESVQLVGPMYYFPTNPRNTFSPSVLLHYNVFNDATISTNKCVTFQSSNLEFEQQVTVYNDLDFITLPIMTLSPTPHVIAANTMPIQLRRSTRIANKANANNITNIDSQTNLDITSSDILPTSTSISNKSRVSSQSNVPSFLVTKDASYNITYNNTKRQLPRIISNSTLLKIIEYSVQLSSPFSPRETTIQTMNTILGTTLRSSEATHPSQNLKLQNLSLHPSNHEMCLPIMANFSRATIRTLTPHQHWVLLHLGTMHTSASSLQHLINNDLLSDLSPSLKDISTFDCTCWICNMRKATKVPKGSLTDTTSLAPFQRLHVDFSFFSVASIRGFTSALDVACASTSYPFGFPTKSKSPPIEILRWLLGTLRSMGYVVNFIRVDEGGELANSSSFAEFVFKQDCILESTGAGNSTNNGKVERPNRTKGDMIRAGLSSLHILIKDDLPEDVSIESFWCLAYCHANFIKRRLFNRLRKDTPHHLVSKRKPSARELVPLGSYMTVIHPSKHLLPKLSHQRATRVYFMGYSNHTKIRLYWDKSNPNMIRRSSNSIIEDVPTLLKLEQCFSSPELNLKPNPYKHDDFQKNFVVSKDKLDIIGCPFNTDEIVKIKIPLPDSSTTLGFVLKSDLVVGLPYIQHIKFNTIAYKYIQAGLRSNVFILSINGDDQLSAQATAFFIQSLQKEKHKYMTLELVKRESQDNITSLVSHRTIFDQVPSLIHTNPTIASSFHKPKSFTEFVTSANKPPIPSSFFEALKSPFKNNWKAAAWKHFLSNKKIVAFSKPFPKVDIPSDAKLFRSLLVMEVKTTDVPGVWQFKIRHAIVGTPQEQYIDYENSYAPTIDPTTVKIQICFTCHCNYTLGIIDVKNAFQNTIAPTSSRLYCSIPPTYLEWLKQVFNEKFDFNQKYIMQMLNSCQGTKDASSLFYNLLRKSLQGYGFVRSTVDHAYFVKPLPNGHHLYASVATDDILVSYPDYRYFEDLKTYLQQFFELSVQIGEVLQFLGVRYIQSDFCITLDQAEYTFSMLEHYFGTDVDHVKTIRTPLRYDSDFERELHDALPLPPKALQIFTIKYKGAYRFWIGKLMFLCTQTRFDIGFAVQRLSEYNVGPTQPAFESITRILRYLAGDVIRPLTYPKRRFDSKDSVTWYSSPNDKKELEVSSSPTLFFDAEFAKDIASRHSYFCNIITVFNVAVLFKIKKSSSIMLHTTDSELKGGSSGVRQLLPVRQLFSFNGHPLPQPSTAFTDNAAVHAIIESNRMTPRCKHIDVPIAFLHQESNQSFKIKLIRTMVMLADMGTKGNTPKYHKEFKYWSSGSRFLPPPSSLHWKLLNMQFYEINYGKILTVWND